MGRYSLRDGKIKAPKMDAKHLALNDVDNEGTYAAPYIKITPVAKSGDDAYLYMGTAGGLRLSSTAPVGTSGTFADIGAAIASSA